MKKIISTLFVVLLVTLTSSSMAAMSLSKVRKNARFLTDRMAYELNLSTMQYNDVYEINYDFIYNIRYVMDDAVRGNELALDRYYLALDIRNDDLRWVLNNGQYIRFMNAEYFYRPVYASGSSWNFRVYVHFTNHSYFYFGKPSHYSTYNGGHYRGHHTTVSVYRNRYNHPIYNSGNHSVRRESVYINNRKSDFGVTSRPSTSTSTSTGSSRPSSGTSTSTVTRPSTNNNSKNSGSSSSGSNRPSSSTSSSSKSSSSSNRPSSTTSGSSSSSSSSSRPSSTTSGSSNSRTSTTTSKSPSSSSSSSSRPSSTNSSSSSSSRSSSVSSGSSSNSSSSSSRSSSGSGSSGSSSSSSRGGSSRR